MVNETFEPQCRMCGDTYEEKRFRLGILLCLGCGDEVAHAVKRTVVPVANSNYVMVTDLSLLKGLNKYANS